MEDRNEYLVAGIVLVFFGIFIAVLLGAIYAGAMAIGGLALIGHALTKGRSN